LSILHILKFGGLRGGSYKILAKIF
jgi:hypothetical protein